MRVEGQVQASGGGWGGDCSTPLPRLTFRERPPAPPSPTRLRQPSGDIGQMQMAMYTGKRPSPTKGMKYGPRPDDWDNPLMLDASAREKIVSLYKSGMSAPNVAKEVGAAKSTVLRHLRAADVEIRGAIKALDTKEIKRRHAEGETVRQLSADYDVAPSTILRRLRSRDEKYA